MSAAPRRSSSSARLTPADAASASVRTTVWLPPRTIRCPSMEATTPSRFSASPVQVPRAPTGAWQPPSTRARIARSAICGQAGRRMIERLEEGDHAVVAGARFDRKRALSGSRHDDVGFEDFGDPGVEAQSLQPRAGEDEGVVVAPVEFRQSRGDVAAHVEHLQIRPPREQLRPAARRRRADARAGRQPGQTRAGGRHQGVTGIGTLEDCRQREAVGDTRGQVLQAVDCDVDGRVLQRVLDLPCEDSRAADPGDGRGWGPIPGCADHRDLDGSMGMRGHEQARNFVGLPRRQVAAAGAEAEHRRGARGRHGRPCSGSRQDRARTARAAGRGGPIRPPAEACRTSAA